MKITLQTLKKNQDVIYYYANFFLKRIYRLYIAITEIQEKTDNFRLLFKTECGDWSVCTLCSVWTNQLLRCIHVLLSVGRIQISIVRFSLLYPLKTTCKRTCIREVRSKNVIPAHQYLPFISFTLEINNVQSNSLPQRISW